MRWAEPLFELGFVRQKDWAGLDTIFYLYIFSNSFLHPLNQKKNQIHFCKLTSLSKICKTIVLPLGMKTNGVSQNSPFPTIIFVFYHENEMKIDKAQNRIENGDHENKK